MAKVNVVLIGFMGTGKTSVGKKLAERLGYRFVDTDRWIEERTGRTIPEIFSREGEPSFREMESRIVEEVSSLSGAVIATGGGVVVRPENFERLKVRGFVVCLKASPEVIHRRVTGESHRPLLYGDDPLGEIKRLLKIREEGYSRADLTIDTTALDVDRVVKEISDHYSALCQEAS